MVIPSCIKTLIPEAPNLSFTNKIPTELPRYPAKKSNLKEAKTKCAKNAQFLVVKKITSLEVLMSSQLTSTTQSPSP